MSLSVNTLQHNTQCWDARLVIKGEKCSYKTKQRACSIFFPLHQDMLSRLCSTLDTHRQIELISAIDQKKTVVFPSVQWLCLSKQDSEQENILLVLWCSVWFVQEGFHMFSLKIICEVWRFSGKGACYYKATNRIITSFQSLELFLDSKKQCRSSHMWVSFHHLNNHSFPALADHAKDYRGREKWAWFHLLVWCF